MRSDRRRNFEAVRSDDVFTLLAITDGSASRVGRAARCATDIMVTLPRRLNQPVKKEMEKRQHRLMYFQVRGYASSM
ncbi:unnamed protein product [Nesidiocoris tenuis]|uniref:Uncharacterized protein n=1 Tax=Nesidiocoris tenuis TaxID=355587 RepID=A0A6H5GDF8_9HEMI|nr:unnamed protein product [Nesidiocoris tenuis]